MEIDAGLRVCVVGDFWSPMENFNSVLKCTNAMDSD